MVTSVSKFEADGFIVVNEILDRKNLLAIEAKCESEITVKTGTRNLLKYDWANKLAQELIQNESIKCLLPKNARAVQCNYFLKDLSNNWSVGLHRDLSIPVKNKISSQEWTGWSNKEGTLYAQPPKSVLAKIVVVRLHLEDNDSENGTLEIVPGSHKTLNQERNRILSFVAQGGALIMRPLLLHSSKKLKSGKRRVLHFVFGPESLPNNAEWANT